MEYADVASSSKLATALHYGSYDKKNLVQPEMSRSYIFSEIYFANYPL